MPFKISGNSNYKLSLNNNIVNKYALEADNRLVLSAEKQREFKSNYFKSPTVFDITNSSFTMEYINGDSFVDFFIRASKRDVDGLINKLDGYFKENIVGYCDIPIQILIEKLEVIPEASNFIEKIKDVKKIRIMVGKCHGDLTFSNMVFAEDIYLLDFLDSFIESPTMDIIKLRQDTQFYWSLNKINNIRDIAKVKIGLEYVDEWIRTKFKIDNYSLLQIVNLYRIFPYTKDIKIKEYLTQNINKLCEHL